MFKVGSLDENEGDRFDSDKTGDDEGTLEKVGLFDENVGELDETTGALNEVDATTGDVIPREGAGISLIAPWVC